MGLGLLDFELIHKLRRIGGLPGHPHVETPYIQANTGSLGMGISKAKGMAIANRLLKAPRKIFVLTGDGELQEGQVWESLTSAVTLGLHEITAIVDRNKIQSDTWVEEVSPPGNVAAKFAAFGWRVETCDGHDFASIGRALTALAGERARPKVLIAETIKGRGVSFMEGPAKDPKGLYEYHSGAPNESEYARGSKELIAVARAEAERAGLGALVLERGQRPARKPALKVERLVNAYGEALVEQAAKNPRVVVLDADLVKDCGLLPFQQQFPDRFVECGIAEQDMVSQAGGMARRGMIPIVHSFACFLSVRPNEHIYNNASEGSKVIYVGSLAGLLPGGPGHSHQSVRDISALAAVPRLIMVEPCAETETKQIVDFCINRTEESSYIRLVSLGWPLPFQLPADYRLTLGRGVVVREGGDAVVFGYGPWLLANAWEAAERIEREQGLRLRLVNLPWLNRVDADWLRATIGAARRVITLDNHYVHGGQGEMLAARIAELGLAVPVTRLGVTELPECGTNDEVLKHHGLDADGLARAFAAIR
jgi:transketolase